MAGAAGGICDGTRGPVARPGSSRRRGLPHSHRTSGPIHHWQSASASLGMGARHRHAPGDACGHACLQLERACRRRPTGTGGHGSDLPALAGRADGHAERKLRRAHHRRNHGECARARCGAACKGWIRHPKARPAGLLAPAASCVRLNRDTLLGAQGSRADGARPGRVSTHSGDCGSSDRFTPAGSSDRAGPRSRSSARDRHCQLRHSEYRRNR